jgi:hypothetical protein
MNKITSFSTFEASSITCFILHSNSHLYLVQATREVISRAKTFLSFIEKGTSHSAIFKASHSTIAVFQTQGSQTKTGLFFVFLFKIATSLSTSISLQIVFSIFHSFASAVKFVEKKSKAGVVLSVNFCQFILLSKGVIHSFCKIFFVKAQRSLLIDSVVSLS